jgi:hypothetical protein
VARRDASLVSQAIQSYCDSGRRSVSGVEHIVTSQRSLHRQSTSSLLRIRKGRLGEEGTGGGQDASLSWLGGGLGMSGFLVQIDVEPSSTYVFRKTSHDTKPTSKGGNCWSRRRRKENLINSIFRDDSKPVTRTRQTHGYSTPFWAKEFQGHDVV